MVLFYVYCLNDTVSFFAEGTSAGISVFINNVNYGEVSLQTLDRFKEALGKLVNKNGEIRIQSGDNLLHRLIHETTRKLNVIYVRRSPLDGRIIKEKPSVECTRLINHYGCTDGTWENYEAKNDVSPTVGCAFQSNRCSFDLLLVSPTGGNICKYHFKRGFQYNGTFNH